MKYERGYKRIKGMIARTCLLIFVWAFSLSIMPCAVAPAQDDAKDKSSLTDDEKRKRFKELIKIKGYWYTKMREYSASGNQHRFESTAGLTTYGNKVEQGTSLSVLFRLGKRLSLDGDVYDMPYQERQMRFGATTGHLRATMGDFVATLQGGAFANFSKKITGAMFEYKTNRSHLTFLSSEPKSVTRSESFRGRNIRGPYDLKGVELIPERVKVRMNGEAMSPDQYILEPFQGDITFAEIITPDDLIEVTYEQTFQVSLDTGSITGIGGGRKSKNGKWAWQFAQLKQEAASSVTTGIEPVPAETPTVTTVPNADGQYILKLAEIGETAGKRKLLVRFGNDPFNTTESITKNGAALDYPDDYNVPGNADAATYLTRGRDLEYRTRGEFVLKDPPVAGDSFSVSYSYYPSSSIQCYQDEPIPVDVDGTAHFANRTVYYGTERLVSCTGNDPLTLTCQNVPLNRHDTLDGYEIDENTNTIYLHGPAANNITYLKAEYYCTYPASLPSGSIYDKSVTSFTVNYTPSAALTVKTDYAVSEADVSAKPISVYGKVLITVAANIACPSAIDPDPCAISLRDTDITPDTERIYFNDVTSADNMQTRHTDYTIDYDTGTLNFTTDIPAGTVIIADYSRQPPELGIRDGHIFRVDSSYKKRRLKLNYKTQRADTFFTNIGGESNLEVENDQLAGACALSDRLNFRFDLFKQRNALDTLGANHQTNRKSRYQIRYSSPRIKNFSYFTYKRKVNDDYPVSRTDFTETSNGFAVGLAAPFIKNLNLTYDRQKSERSDDAPLSTSPDSDTLQQGLGLTYKLGKLDATAKFGTNRRTSTDYAGAPYSITTDTSNVNLRYDFNLFRTSTSLDKQQTTDTRPGGEGSSVQSTRVSLETRPFWRVQSLRVNHSRQDRPAVNTPTTSTTSTSCAAPIRISPDLQLTTSYVVTRNSVGGSSNSRSTNTSHTLEYRPPGRPYHVIYTTSRSNTTSTSAGSSSTTSSSRNQINAGYTPGGPWAHSASLQSETTSSGSVGSYKSSILTFVSRYSPSERKKYSLQYNQTRRSGTIAERFTTYNFGLDYIISKLLSWKFNWKRNRYNNTKNPSQNFTGDLMETELRATF